MSTSFINSEIPEGVIIPPGKVKETIEKTAGYIARNGNNFKNRLLSENESSEKFSFLKEEDPFYKYYEFCIKEYKLNGNTVKSSIKQDSIASSSSINNKDNDRIKEELKSKENDFIMDISNINAKDLKIIKLTALQCAANADDPHYNIFLEGFQKYLFELNKFQFEFLKKEHRLNYIFEKYLKQYKSIMRENNNEDLQLDSRVTLVNESKHGEDRCILDYCYLLAERKFVHEKNLSIEKKKIEKQKLEYASVDWNDVKIVATIDFTETDKFSELPTPWKKNELIYRSIEQKNNAKLLIEEAPPSYIPEEEEEVNSERNSQPNGEPTPPPDTIKRNIKIRSAGETRLKKQNNSQKVIKSPITGEMIPEDKFELHMKTVLRDPRYEQERQNYIRKNHTYGSNLTEAEVFKNIKRLRGEDMNNYNSQPNKKTKY